MKYHPLPLLLGKGEREKENVSFGKSGLRMNWNIYSGSQPALAPVVFHLLH